MGVCCCRLTGSFPGIGISFFFSSFWTSTPAPVSRQILWRGWARQTFLEQDSFQQRILVPEHEALICCRAVALLKALQSLILLLDGSLELLDVLGPSLSKGGLRLAVTLLPLLRGRIDLAYGQSRTRLAIESRSSTHRLPAPLSLLHGNVGWRRRRPIEIAVPLGAGR